MTIDVLDIDLATADGLGLLRALERDHGDKIARAASLMERLFLLRSPWAPGLRFAGGLTGPAGGMAGGPPQRFSCSGTSLAITDALASCIGEAVERTAQIERAGDTVEAGFSGMQRRIPESIRERIFSIDPRCVSSDAKVAWIRARPATSDDEVYVPADWCLRRQAPGALAIAGHALSTGAAAGPSWEGAALRAILELIERDAAALWWIGGARGRHAALEAPVHSECARLIAELRQSGWERRTWLLDITTDLGIPVCAALSIDGNGRGLACGLAARSSYAAAARAAVLEMCQMEVGLILARGKLTGQPHDRLSESEQALVDRADDLDARSCELLYPAGLGAEAGLPMAAGERDLLAHLLDRLSQSDMDVYLVDLTRSEIGIPVAAAIAPRLQIMPGDLTVARLRAQIASTDGAKSQTRRHKLF